jgi:MFS-type transporter involved in bile tolerance (Atg22 family)
MFYNQVEAKWAFGLVAGTFGIFLTPISSIIVSYTSEVVYPLDEGSSTGYLFAISQTFGFAMGVLTINVLNNDPNRAKIILSIFLVMMLIGLIAMISTKEDLRKTKFEKGLLGK